METELNTQTILAAVAQAYAHLWRVNNEPGTPNQYPSERAAYQARRLLRELLTKEQRGAAINALLAEKPEVPAQSSCNPADLCAGCRCQYSLDA